MPKKASHPNCHIGVIVVNRLDSGSTEKEVNTVSRVHPLGTRNILNTFRANPAVKYLVQRVWPAGDTMGNQEIKGRRAKRASSSNNPLVAMNIHTKYYVTAVEQRVGQTGKAATNFRPHRSEATKKHYISATMFSKELCLFANFSQEKNTFCGRGNATKIK